MQPSTRRTITGAGIACLLLAGGCAAPQTDAAAGAAPADAITGTVTYLPRIALTEQAVLEVVLLESEGPDGPTRVVGEAVMDNPGQVPIAFVLPYDPAAIEPGRDYAVAARIADGDGPLFMSPLPVPVLTDGEPSAVEVLVEMSGTADPLPVVP